MHHKGNKEAEFIMQAISTSEIVPRFALHEPQVYNPPNHIIIDTRTKKYTCEQSQDLPLRLSICSAYQGATFRHCTLKKYIINR